MMMVLVRDDCTTTRTLGTLTFPDGFVCQTLEDPVRPDGVKFAGDTAIPAGRYPVTITKSTRFGYMLPLLSDVPLFTGIRIHPGNTTADTEGCILVATSRGTHDNIVSSKAAMAQVQRRIAVALTDAQGVCTIDIRQRPVTSVAEAGAGAISSEYPPIALLEANE